MTTVQLCTMVLIHSVAMVNQQCQFFSRQKKKLDKGMASLSLTGSGRTKCIAQENESMAMPGLESFIQFYIKDINYNIIITLFTDA